MSNYPNGPQMPYQQPGQPQQGYPSNPGYPPQEQMPYPQQTGYPPNYQQPPQPPQPAKKKPGKFAIGCGALVAIVALVIVVNAATGNKGNSSTTSSPSDSTSSQAAPAKPQSWQTTHTYSGNGNQKTETISVADDWKIQWTCDPTSFDGMSYNVIVEVDNTDGSPQDVAINTTCSNGNSSGSTEEHAGGSVYLNITSEAKWTVTVSELK